MLVRRWSSIRRQHAPEHLQEVVEPLGSGLSEGGQQRLLVGRMAGCRIELARAQRLGERLLERPANRHRLTDRLHVGREVGLGAEELLEPRTAAI